MSDQTPTRTAIIASVTVFALALTGWGIFAASFTETGWDFSQFYIAASIPAESLYDRPVYEQFAEDELAPLGVTYFPPYVRPAVFALPLKLLAPLSYRGAEGLFFAVQFAFYLATLWLSSKRYGLPWHWLPLFALFPPATLGIITGQDPHTVGLLAFFGYLLLERDREVAAGLVWALCLYKFSLVLGLPLLLLARGKRKALAAFVVGGALLAAASIALAPPGDYLALLRSIDSYTVDFSPAAFIGLYGIAYVAGLPALYPAAALAVMGLSLAPLRRAPLPVAFAVAVLASLLCAYHVNWYDAVMLMPCFVYVLSEKEGALKFLTIAMLGFLQLWTHYQWVAVGLFLLWAAIVLAERSSESTPSATAAG